MKKPILSICIPTYNRASCLRECLESLLASLASVEDPIEIVISDNASTDETQTVIREFKKRDKRIRVHRNAENIGAEKNIYQVNQMAKGEYIWCFGDDDKFEKDAILEVLKKIKDGYDLIVLNYSVWSKDFKTLKIKRHMPLKEDRIFEDPNELLEKIGGYIGYISCVIVKKERFFKLPKEEYERWMPFGFPHLYAIYFGIFPKSKTVYLSRPLIQNRTDNSGSYDVYTYFVEGISGIFIKLNQLGYTSSAIYSAQKTMIEQFIFRNILARARDGKTRKGLFTRMYPHYKNMPSFWLFCIPALLAPGLLMRTSYKILSGYRAIQRLFP